MVKTFNDVGLSSVLQQTVVIDLDDIKVNDIYIFIFTSTWHSYISISQSVPLKMPIEMQKELEFSWCIRSAHFIWQFVLTLRIGTFHWYYLSTHSIETLHWHSGLALCIDTFYWNANSVGIFLAHPIRALCLAICICIGTLYWHFLFTLCIDTLHLNFLMKCKQCWNLSCASDPRTLCVRLFSGSTPLFTLLAESTRLSGNLWLGQGRAMAM